MRRYIVKDGRANAKDLEDIINQLYQQGYKILNVSSTFMRADYNGSVYDYLIICSEGE